MAEGAQILFISANLDFSDRGELRIFLLAEASAPVGSVVYADACFVAPKIYPTPWHIGGGTRANPVKQITLPEALPSEFGVGIAAMLMPTMRQTGHSGSAGVIGATLTVQTTNSK